MPSQEYQQSPERAAALRRRAAEAASSAEADVDRQPHPLVALGGRVGNAQIARLLQREGAPDEEEIATRRDSVQRQEEEEEVAAKRDPVQREGEEEEMAAKHDPLQREGEEEDGEAMLDAKRDDSAAHAAGCGCGRCARQVDASPAPEVGMEGGPLSADLAGRINARRGGGGSLDGGTRATMESSFGAGFGDVRVHTDSEADAFNRSISAKAFTTGSDIFFRGDASPSDHGLLAHELTHVVQQRGATGGGGGGLTVGPAADSSEHQADAVSAAVTSGAAAQAQRQAAEEEEQAMAKHAAAQRQEEEEEPAP